jgi:hypothetical protein
VTEPEKKRGGVQASKQDHTEINFANLFDINKLETRFYQNRYKTRASKKDKAEWISILSREKKTKTQREPKGKKKEISHIVFIPSLSLPLRVFD